MIKNCPHCKKKIYVAKILRRKETFPLVKEVKGALNTGARNAEENSNGRNKCSRNRLC